MKRKFYILNVALCVFIIVLITGIILLIKNYNKKLEDNTTIRCFGYSSAADTSLEEYFSYRNGKMYEYSVILKSKIKPEDYEHFETAKKLRNQYNEITKGYVTKVWHDDEYYYTMDVYLLDLFDENDFKKFFFQSKDEFIYQTREDIKKWKEDINKLTCE